MCLCTSVIKAASSGLEHRVPIKKQLNALVNKNYASFKEEIFLAEKTSMVCFIFTIIFQKRMELGKTLYVTNRKQWRSWLNKNHNKENEIWLVYYRKSSNKERIPYNDAVEEALCYGWIDSTIKGIDDKSFAQRFTPRRSNSVLSQLNKERIHRLIEQKKMTNKGLDAVSHVYDPSSKNLRCLIKDDILKLLKNDKQTWKNFQKFPESYKRIRIGWIECARTRPEIFKKRLDYFLKMTSKNKKYGMMQ